MAMTRTDGLPKDLLDFLLDGPMDQGKAHYAGDMVRYGYGGTGNDPDAFLIMICKKNKTSEKEVVEQAIRFRKEPVSEEDLSREILQAIRSALSSFRILPCGALDGLILDIVGKMEMEKSYQKFETGTSGFIKQVEQVVGDHFSKEISLQASCFLRVLS